MPALLYLMRHGETAWNREKRLQGHADIALNDVGQRQALELGRRAARLPLAALYSSDLTRATDTARAVAAHFPGLTIQIDPRLRELDGGRLAGLTPREIAQGWSQWLDENKRDPFGCRFPDGESLAELRERVLAAVAGMVARYPDQGIGVVSHGGPIKQLVAHVLGLAPERIHRFVLDNCGLTVLEWGAKPRLLTLNSGDNWGTGPDSPG